MDRFQILRNPSTIYKALRQIRQGPEEIVRNYNGRLQVLVVKLQGENVVERFALMNYFTKGLLPMYRERVRLLQMQNYEQV